MSASVLASLQGNTVTPVSSCFFHQRELTSFPQLVKEVSSVRVNSQRYKKAEWNEHLPRESLRNKMAAHWLNRYPHMSEWQCFPLERKIWGWNEQNEALVPILACCAILDFIQKFLKCFFCGLVVNLLLSFLCCVSVKVLVLILSVCVCVHAHNLIEITIRLFLLID